jgi:hyperosmotically inducible protein
MHKIITLATLIITMLVGGVVTFGQETAKPADNTKVNKRDRKAGAVTADQQKENTADREIAAKIRKALMDDKALSTYAHNVKVVAQHGTVTLKGPVRSEEEKKAVEAKAAEIAGADKVTSQISIRAKKSEARAKKST